MSLEPFNAALKETTNSGVLVPNATTVRPTASGDMPNCNESAEAPLTNISAPKVSSARDISASRIVVSNSMAVIRRSSDYIYKYSNKYHTDG
jgi:hypothetical protein